MKENDILLSCLNLHWDTFAYLIFFSFRIASWSGADGNTYLFVTLLSFILISGMRLFGFWEEVNKVISDSELVSGIPYSSAVPGLIQYLESITKLVLSVLSVTAGPDIQSSSSPVAKRIAKPALSIAHLLQCEFHEVRLLALEAVLLWLKQINSKQIAEGGGVLCLLPDFEGTLLTMALKEKNFQCFCKVGGCYFIDIWYVFSELYS